MTTSIQQVGMNLRVYQAFVAGIVTSLALVLFLPFRAVADTDVGNIAVIETDPTILQPGELFDLNSQTLTFTPRAGGGYTVSVGALSFDTNLGTNLGLGDDGSVSQALSFTFPFFGSNRTTVFINSNGYMTFGSASSLVHFNSGGSVSTLGDASTVLDNIAGGFPRIAVLWQDWDPSAGGGVFANSLSDRLVVTWSGVPLFGTSTTTTFQVVLFSNGIIQMSYQSVTTTPVGGYLTGTSPGSRSEFTTTTLNLGQGGSSISLFPNFEPLVQVFGSASSPLVHVPAVARRFYRTHSDQFDQFVMFANFTNALGNAFAFELTTRQTVSGIGLNLFDISSFFGSQGRLQSSLNMNRLSLYPADPNTTFLGTNNTLDLMGQESGHMWLAFAGFDDGGVCSNLLLGRDLAHWSFFKDSDASDMEGNDWTDSGNGTFTSTDATSRFSPLDQYIMGLRATSEVPSFFFIDNPSGTTRTRSSAPEIGVTTSGTRKNATVSQVIICEGARSPSSGFSGVNATTTWKQAFILLIQGGTTAPNADITKIDTIRAAWVPYFNTATGGRGTVDTTLGGITNTAPFGFIDVPAPGATVQGTINVEGWVLDQESSSLTVELLVDGSVVSSSPTRFSRPDVCAAFPSVSHCSSSNPGVRFSWNTTTVGNGAHTLALRVTDPKGASAIVGSRTVTVNNPANTAPFGYIDVPALGATVQGTLNVEGWVLDQEDSSLTVQLLVDGTAVSSSLTRFSRPDVCAAFPSVSHCSSSNPGVRFSWNTTTVGNGAHSLAFRVTDPQGASTTVGPRTVTVNNTNTAPFGFVDVPAPGATVQGTIGVIGWGLDQEDSSLTVQFLVDGSGVSSSPTRFARPDVCAAFPNISHCSSSNPGVIFSWNTTTVGNGAHSLALRVTDPQGASATVGSRTVTVNNP